MNEQNVFEMHTNRIYRIEGNSCRKLIKYVQTSMQIQFVRQTLSMHNSYELESQHLV